MFLSNETQQRCVSASFLAQRPYMALQSNFFLQLKLNASEEQHSELAEHFLNIRVPSEPQFAEYLLASRSVQKQMNPTT